MIYRSKAPLRVSFAGGGTDMPSWAKEHGGQVISTTINKYINISVKFNQSSEVLVKAYDLDKTAKLSFNNLEYDGNFDLIKASLKHFNVNEGCEIHIHSDLPAGSGMGTSSSLLVALISVFALYKNIPMSKDEIAKLACEIERGELANAGGYQDQYAAAFGGFNFITFTNTITVHPLRIPKELLNELNYRLVLCYTGKTHISADMIKITLLDNYGKKDFEECMNKLKKYAAEIRDVLLQGKISNLDTIGEILKLAWTAKKQCSNKITNPDVEKLLMHSLENGAIGGKLLGAGGGGHILLFVKPMKRMKVINKLKEVRGKIVNFQFDQEGVTSWCVK